MHKYLGDTIDKIMEDSTEDNKVDVKEACVNLNFVKKEQADEVVKFEENLHVTQYRVTLENIFGVALCKREVEEYDGNLIGFLDNDAIMENVIIKLAAIKAEGENFDYCNKCNGDYKGFCLKCSTLLHILNNASPLTSSESERNTAPMDILEIRDTSVEKGVFLLQTLPKNIIFGPFEGISALRNGKGDGWKINNKRLENAEMGNWMKDIACATSASTNNLYIFQMKGHLYFQTNREIMEGEELLVDYDDEEVKKLDDSQECYFIPWKHEDFPKIFACTLCCLGFQLIECLVEHKSKCPHAEHNTDIKDLELVECHCCKIWLEKHEHQKYHMSYCWEKYLRMSYLQPQPVDRNQVKVEDDLNTKAVHGRFKCSQCLYKTSNNKNLQRHLNTHKKHFQCDICKTNYCTKGNLKFHIKNKHAEDGSAKDYKCSECTYQTKYKQNYQRHLNGHRGIKLFECGICKTKFTLKNNLKRHIKNNHTKNGSAKDHQCSECTYQTNRKHDYQTHLNVHRGIKPFECGICKTKFTLKRTLKKHIKNNHTNDACAKDYQCSECAFQTNDKTTYQTHVNRHLGIKPFDCVICEKKFTQKSHLNVHIKDNHVDYQCSECTYQANDKRDYQNHLNVHHGIKLFECGICKMKFTQTRSLNAHIKNKHTENVNPFKCDICKKEFTRKYVIKSHIKNKHTKNAKDFQCSECIYQTNYKHNYQRHLNWHRGIKPFDCGICEMKFIQKSLLNKHIKNKHVENGCPECSYQTNDKLDYQIHLNGHRGIKPFECGICKMKFTQKRSLKSHIKKKHT